MTMLEPAVALTDFALALACGLFAFLLSRQAPAPTKPAFTALFAGTGLSALLGGISHGFVPGSELLWQATLLSISLAALATWIAAARLALPGGLQRTIILFGVAAFVAQSVYILFVGQSFLVAIISYVPGALFLLIAFALAYRRRPSAFLLAGLAGSLLTFVAAGVQQMGISLHPDYFDHNAFYHLIQGIALLLLFHAARGLIKDPPR